ncbi:MAG TPA: hypothetical protein PK961_04945 [bacterium]|nr:hypothetical protein [bacterium]
MKYMTVRNMQRAFTWLVLLSVSVCALVFGFNYFNLQRPVNRILEQDERNAGVRVSVYYDSYVDTDMIVFDVRFVGPPAGYPGLFRVFFQFAREMQGRDIENVMLAYNGRQKLKIKGDDFQELGASFGAMQPRQLLWELARNLRLLNGRLVMSNIPGDYAKMLEKNLSEDNELQAASALFNTFSQ